MHKLQRGEEPACLANYQHGRDKWSHFVRDGNTPIIWAAVDKMQLERCAYCEAEIGEPARHIEHFRQRSRYPQGTFRWDNIFGSCNCQSSCGTHKDQSGNYAHEVLIKPDEEDPDRFFVFVTDGTIALKTNLTPTDAQRASETLRIFGLNPTHGRLRNERRLAVAGYLQTADTLRELSETYPPEEWLPFYEEEVERIKDQPFCTAIRHALTPQQDLRRV